MKNILISVLFVSMALYFCICTIGRAKIDAEQIEATRLHIEVLKLELNQLKNVIDNEPTKQL